MNYIPTIGLEVHAQLATRTKIFCGCAVRFGEEPNTATCPVCLGMPGVLPVLNREVVALAVRAAVALGCEVQERSIFARKNYFYPDLPKGYQISQFEHPLATGGRVEFPVPGGIRSVALTRIHLEEDAGKLVHGEGATSSVVDLNRAGVPLAEIVGEPDLGSPAEAGAYLKSLRSILRYLDVCGGDMEKGEFRCDANVSVRPEGQVELGVKAEIKNLNSFRHVQRALEYEIHRQTELLGAGGRVVQETRLWNPDKGITVSMRSKEHAHDYRYFPEPDLPPLVVAPATISQVRATLPRLPAERSARYVDELELSSDDAAVLTESRPVADLFEALVAGGAPARLAANWVMGEVLRVMNRDGLEEPPVDGGRLGELLAAVVGNEISQTAGKQVFEEMVASGNRASAIIEALGLRQVSDSDALAEIVDRVLAENPDAVEKYREGKKQLIGFFVGRVMKAMQGRANPKMVNDLLQQRLGDQPRVD